MKQFVRLAYLVLVILGAVACNQQNSEKTTGTVNDSSAIVSQPDVVIDEAPESSEASPPVDAKQTSAGAITEQPVVMIYNFHVTNRCVSCIAIEEATTKTLATYFSEEVKQGRIKRQIINVDDKENKAISEKYEAFGSGIVVTRVYKGEETTTDLTGVGFRYAKNKEEKYIEVLKNQIAQYLK